MTADADRPVWSVLDKLDAFASATRELEKALVLEQARGRKSIAELAEVRATYERIVSDGQRRTKELEIRNAKLAAASGEATRREAEVRERARRLSVECRSTREELTRYKAAWAGVLQREREAKLILSESGANSRKHSETEGRARELQTALEGERDRREQAERHAKSYQVELQSALVRIHSAEARFTEISKELLTLQRTKKSADQEIARIEQTLRERLKWEGAKERENIRAELEKDAAVERELFREELRKSHQLDLERLVAKRDAEMSRVREEFERNSVESSRRLQEAQVALRESEQRLAAFEERMGAIRVETASLRERLVAEASRESERVAELASRLTSAEERVGKLSEEATHTQRKIHEDASRSSSLLRDLEEAGRTRAEAERRAESSARALEAERAARAAEVTAVEKELRAARNDGARDQLRATQELEAHRRRAVDRGTEVISRLNRLRAKARARKERIQWEASVRVDEAMARSTGMEAALETEVERSRGLAQALLQERERFEAVTAQLVIEVERLRSVHPLREVILAKDAEIASARARVLSLPKGSPSRQDAHRAAKALLGQRRQLAKLEKDAARRLDTQSRRIRRAEEISTWLAMPPEIEYDSIIQADSPEC